MRVSWSRNLAALVAALAAAVFGYQQIAAGPAEHVLAVSWQPAFCETRPRLPECRSQTADRFDATNFALHGLWPQPRSQAYCGVDERTVAQDKRRRWRDLPWERLDDDLWSRLRQAMPGTRSGLHKHEWIKHGTCYDGAGAVEYFEDSLKLLEALNRSEVRDLFAGNIGRELNGDEIRAAFDRSFGPGAGDRVRISCKNDGARRLIVELTIGVSGRIEPDSYVAAHILAADATDPGCPGGVVDPVGNQ
jgi:ribonuclease T2